jgi:predicted PurR-regulated permease PerM
MDNKNLLDISWGTIFKVTLAFFCFYFLYLIRDVLILAFFALIFSILFNPAIDFLQRKKIPRSLAVIFVYLGFFGIISLFIYLTASLFLQEVQQFSQFFPQYFEKISPYLKGLGMDIFESSEIFVKTIHDWLIRISSNTFSVLRSIFGGFFSVFLVITISVFLSLEENFIEKSLILIFPKKYKNLVLDIWQRSQVKISNWFAAKIIGCLFVGALSFLTFFLFNVKYYFLLAFLAGILDFVPIIGPISTGILILLLISLNLLN